MSHRNLAAGNLTFFPLYFVYEHKTNITTCTTQKIRINPHEVFEYLFFRAFLNSGLSEKEKLQALNRQRNLEGWFDKIFEQFDFHGSEKFALFAGDAVISENETCSVRCQLTQTGDLVMVVCHENETKCVTVNRLTGERKVDFYVKHPFEYEE